MAAYLPVPFNTSLCYIIIEQPDAGLVDYRAVLPFFELLGGVRTPKAGDGGLRLDNGAEAYSLLCSSTSACLQKTTFKLGILLDSDNFGEKDTKSNCQVKHDRS